MRIAQDSRTERRSGSIVLNAAREEALRRILCEGMADRSCRRPPLNAKINEVAIERLELCHEGPELE